jgi:hypothetical protein
LCDIKDSRQSAKITYPLFDILFLPLCSVISGAVGWKDIEEYAKGHLDWFQERGFLPHGVPVDELAFEHEGQAYYLTGKKIVKDDPSFDLCKDSTTLYKGIDKEAPIVGAGVLRLGIKELVKLATSIHACNAKMVAEKVAAISNVSSFFMGKLWTAYAKFVSDKL